MNIFNKNNMGSKKGLNKKEQADADMKRMNGRCLPPFLTNGVEMISFLCQVGRGRNFPLYTYVYAADRETAQKILDANYSDFDTRTVVTEK
jgi:hypothetical protein